MTPKATKVVRIVLNFIEKHTPTQISKKLSDPMIDLNPLINRPEPSIQTTLIIPQYKRKATVLPNTPQSDAKELPKHKAQMIGASK
jgi:hypothetical protein